LLEIELRSDRVVVSLYLSTGRRRRAGGHDGLQPPDAALDAVVHGVDVDDRPVGVRSVAEGNPGVGWGRGNEGTGRVALIDGMPCGVDLHDRVVVEYGTGPLDHRRGPQEPDYNLLI